MWRLTSMTFVAILSLGMAGNVMESNWQPAAYDPPTEYRALSQSPLLDDQRVFSAIRTEQVTVDSSGHRIEGLVYSPDDTGVFPGVVFVHGAGTKDRTGFAEQAEHLASAGSVVLVLDKRMDTYSAWHRDYEAMATDTLSGVEFLRGRTDVDPAQVGVFGESEGSWIASVAAATDPDIGFVVMVSAPVVPPAEQATYATLMAFEGLDVPAPVKRAVAKGIGMAMSLPGVLDYAAFDIGPWLSRIEQPILMVYGTEDTSVPLIEGPEQVRAAVPGPVTVRYFGGAQHGIRMGSSDAPFAAGYLDTLSAWIRDPQGPAAEPAIAGSAPEQTISAAPVPPAPWYATAYAHIVIISIAVAGYLAGPVAALAVRARRRREGDLAVTIPSVTAARRRSLWWVRSLGLASLAGLVAYFFVLSHLALNHLTSPLLTYGMWAAVWLITAAAVMSVINLRYGGTWRTAAADVSAVTGATAPVTRVEKVSLAGAAGGTILLLLTVTYWGVFLGI